MLGGIVWTSPGEKLQGIFMLNIEWFLPLFIKGKPFWFHQTVLINMFYRWVRFEEDIEENGKRWSKPHVPALPLASFIEFRQCFTEGMVALDVPGNSLEDIIGTYSLA